MWVLQAADVQLMEGIQRSEELCESKVSIP